MKVQRWKIKKNEELELKYQKRNIVETIGNSQLQIAITSMEKPELIEGQKSL